MMKDKKLDEAAKALDEARDSAAAQTEELSDEALDGVAGGIVTHITGTGEMQIN